MPSSRKTSISTVPAQASRYRQAGKRSRAGTRPAPSETGRPRAVAAAAPRPSCTSRTVAPGGPNARSMHVVRSRLMLRVPPATPAVGPGHRARPTRACRPRELPPPAVPRAFPGRRWLINRRPPRSMSAATTTCGSSASGARTLRNTRSAPTTSARPSATSVAAAPRRPGHGHPGPRSTRAAAHPDARAVIRRTGTVGAGAGSSPGPCLRRRPDSPHARGTPRRTGAHARCTTRDQVHEGLPTTHPAPSGVPAAPPGTDGPAPGQHSHSAAVPGAPSAKQRIAAAV